MYIDTHQLKSRTSVLIDETVDLRGMLDDVQELIAIAPLRLRLTAMETVENTYRVHGSATTVMTLRCSRCLSPFSRQEEISFDEMFSTAQDVEDLDVNVFDGEALDLLPSVKQAVLLSIPYAPVCKASCLGLCPQCGTNLNEQSCGCQQRAIDPRWEKLSRFFED